MSKKKQWDARLYRKRHKLIFIEVFSPSRALASTFLFSTTRRPWNLRTVAHRMYMTQVNLHVSRHLRRSIYNVKKTPQPQTHKKKLLWNMSACFADVPVAINLEVTTFYTIIFSADIIIFSNWPFSCVRTYSCLLNKDHKDINDMKLNLFLTVQIFAPSRT